MKRLSNVKEFASKHGKLISIILIIIAALFIGAISTYIILRQHITDANDEIHYLKMNMDKELSNEISHVKKAVDDLKKNKPVIETVNSVKETRIEYVPKLSPNDADVDIRKDAPSAKIKYNDKTYDVPLKTTSTSTTEKDGTVKITEGQELTIDVTNIADRQIAAYKLSMDEKQRELNEELKKVKKENRVHKTIETAAIALGSAYLIKKAID